MEGEPRTLYAPDFDVLYDSPILVGNQEVLTFDVRGIPYEFAANDRPEERPVHTVRITRSFMISIHEVAFEQYDLFSQATGAERADDMGFGRGRLPVIGVDWYDATAYCNWLSAKHSLAPCYSGKGKGTACDFSADGYRLPTEAEWEYAARGGPKAQGFIFAGGADPVQICWHAANRANPRPLIRFH